MSFCKPGDKPKVMYSFSGSGEKVFMPNTSPIDVATSVTDNSDIQGATYAWNFSTSLNPRTTLNDMPFRAKGILHDFKVGAIQSTDTYNGRTIASWYCSFKDGDNNEILGSAIGYYPSDTPTLVKILIPGDYTPEQNCKIEVKNAQGTVLFSDTGKCPCKYQVACGRCPEGQCECPSPGYPGYCCLDCDAIAKEIHSITQSLKEREHGGYMRESGSGISGTTF
ncbi:MAG: hypothetical protein V7L25_31030 [Nostoc sp.]|uniref:hypothetical protein n=1 Tax=Nostoc sp. TaxID=1180 RepID=UPI002FF300E7